MPKSAKKRKTSHHHSSITNNGTSLHILSHEEIWDDSALLRSWNDALAEYDFYHSIHAKGEDVEEVLRRAELEAQIHSKGEVGDGGGDGDEQLYEQAAIDQKMADDIVDTHQVEGTASDGDEEGEIVDGDNAQATTMKEIQAEEGQPLSTSSAILPPDPGTESAIRSGDLGEQGLDQAEGAGPGPGTGTGTDQLLENIKMSYYWAGYYSGLYDAQRGATK